jgi:hypothetical protein
MTIKLFKIDEVFDDKDLIAGFFSSHIAFHPTKSENNESYVSITEM